MNLLPSICTFLGAGYKEVFWVVLYSFQQYYSSTSCRWIVHVDQSAVFSATPADIVRHHHEHNQQRIEVRLSNSTYMGDFPQRSQMLIIHVSLICWCFWSQDGSRCTYNILSKRGLFGSHSLPCFRGWPSERCLAFRVLSSVQIVWILIFLCILISKIDEKSGSWMSNQIFAFRIPIKVRSLTLPRLVDG